ncbi:hypothetical protein HYH02_007179 [Chlamydomonas schloesseri]|uniref:Uncharacterized protein n=1 Tax=Chlamydomonas schloesseri TaxID=2026947 RepID=A0A835WHJ4_9CHLO|nr:hypothetical protein HYH02_007179 [Chlamydomonas schloesseri]|eukprot:KAG2447719.1 hypothetical protein HYH02_007179 [Chlamydomonas schloesseri]
MDSDEEIVERRPQRNQVIVPTLKEITINVLGRYKHCLGDIGWVDPESLRALLWHCNAEQLALVEDETRTGSDRELEWYTWHLWRRLMEADLGSTAKLESPPLESEPPPDYTHPRGVTGDPGDYRTLYARRKAEMEERAAAAKERIAAAYQIANQDRESRKAKMIDKLAPAKRTRTLAPAHGPGARGSSAGGAHSAFLHKPRADSRSSVMGKPGAQAKLLKELGLVRPAPRPATSVRVIRTPAAPPPVSSAATGRSSSLAGAALLSRATGGALGQVGKAAGSGGAGGSKESTAQQPPQVAARQAAVAAARAAAAASSAPTSSASPASGITGFRSNPHPLSGSPSPAAGSKRSAPDAAGSQPAGKLSRPGPASGPGAGAASGSPGVAKPDPRVMFPRQAPPSSSPGQSKFAVPTARNTQASTGPPTIPPPKPAAAGFRVGDGPKPARVAAVAGGGRAGGGGGGARCSAGAGGLRPSDDL